MKEIFTFGLVRQLRTWESEGRLRCAVSIQIVGYDENALIFFGIFATKHTVRNRWYLMALKGIQASY